MKREREKVINIERERRKRDREIEKQSEQPYYGWRHTKKLGLSFCPSLVLSVCAYNIRYSCRQTDKQRNRERKSMRRERKDGGELKKRERETVRK